MTNTLVETNFDAVFGTSNVMDTFTFYEEPDPRDELIKQLKAEIEKLKNGIALMRNEVPVVFLMVLKYGCRFLYQGYRIFIQLALLNFFIS